MGDRFLNEKLILKSVFRFFTPQNSVKHNIIYLTLQNNNNNMTFLLSTLPVEIEDIIAKNVEYKRNFKEVCKVINRLGECRDIEFEENNINTEYEQYENSDMYWLCVGDSLDYHFVSDKCFNYKRTNEELYDTEYRRYYYHDDPIAFHPDCTDAQRRRAYGLE